MIVEPAPAKINLALHVRGRRADGFHEIETLFAFLRDGDQITAERYAENELTVTGPFAAALAGHDNLVSRAASAFSAAFAPDARYRLSLAKHLPIASGIGGGSADAAATLRALARLEGVDPSDPRLIGIAEALGSDVPACLLGKAALGTGRGELLAPLDGLGAMPVLLVNPGVAVSTAAVFKAWDGKDLGPIGSSGEMNAAREGRNDLQPAALDLAPEIGDVLAALAGQPGVVLARMSGSGATCFGLFENAAAMVAASAVIAAAHPDWWRLESALA
ncbi:4-(cytidine 5'-diphospho)-2-C-methyl-D-erythritol kinase [soil metagenome]